MSSSGDAGGLGVLLLLPFAILLTMAYCLPLIACGIAFILFWVALGIGANLAVRIMIGCVSEAWGVATPLVGRIGLVIVLLSPPVSLLLACIVALLRGLVVDVVGWLVILCLLIFSLPAYYYGWWAKEIPKVHWSLNLPFQTEAVMRAEETIVCAQALAFLSTLQFRLRLLCYEWLGLRM